MLPTEIDQATLGKIREITVANFTGRDELYAAANSLDNEARRQVCRRLADHLAGHAVELQQILMASHAESTDPLDVDALAELLFDFAKTTRGEPGVLAAAVAGQCNLKQEYDRALESTSHPGVENVLQRQRDEVEFGQQILRGMKASESDQQATDKGK